MKKESVKLSMPLLILGLILILGVGFISVIVSFFQTHSISGTPLINISNDDQINTPNTTNSTDTTNSITTDPFINSNNSSSNSNNFPPSRRSGAS